MANINTVIISLVLAEAVANISRATMLVLMDSVDYVYVCVQIFWVLQ